MARQRQVFPRDTVAHLWAVGAQDQARDAGHNFYFVGGSLYSYGSHFVIAHVLDSEAGQGFRRVIWNDAKYGNTTSKHQNHAWQALSQEQRSKCLRVPSLNQDKARAIERALIAKRVPECTDDILQTIRELIASTSKMRHGSGPFCHALHLARTYQETAQAFYTRAKKRYPMPIIGAVADVPTEKQARAAWVLTFARVLIANEYQEKIKEAARFLAMSADAMGNPDAHLYEKHVQSSTYDNAQRAERMALLAQTAYGNLHAGKKSAAANRILRDIAPMIAEFARRKDNAQRADESARLTRVTRQFYKLQRANKARRLRDLPGYVNQMRDAVSFLALPADDIRAIAVARMLRIDDAACAERSAKSAAESFKSARSYEPQWPGDAKRCYVQGLEHLKHVRRYAPRMAEYLLQNVQSDAMHAQARLVAIDAEIQAQEAQKIADWISGESNMRPNYDAGTFARIRGGNIETTRGASVPIEHACRLARVFDRVVSAGGKSWVDGAGPMVGHYRVNHIGADGALVIGCHEFNPTEARRLRDILNACPECVSVHAESTNG